MRSMPSARPAAIAQPKLVESFVCDLTELKNRNEVISMARL